MWFFEGYDFLLRVMFLLFHLMGVLLIRFLMREFVCGVP